MNEFIPTNYEEFLELAAEGTVVPVATRISADLLTPVAAYLKLENLSSYSFLLESVEGGERLARYSFLGFEPHLIVRSFAGKVIIESGASKEETTHPMFDILRKICADTAPVGLADMPPLVSGAVGYISYDAVRWFEKIPDKNRDELQIDDAVMIFFSRLVIFDHVKSQIHLIANVFTQGKTEDLEAEYEAAVESIKSMGVQLRKPIKRLPRRGVPKKIALHSNMTKEEYERAVMRAKEYIAAGDIFQVVLSQRFEVGLSAHPFEVYRALREVNPSPYMFYLKVDDLSIGLLP